MFFQHPKWFISLQTIENCGLLLSYNNSEDGRFFHEFTTTINHTDWPIRACTLIWLLQLYTKMGNYICSKVKGNPAIIPYFYLVYTTQVNSTFRARWLASSEVISQVLFTSEQLKETKMAFVGVLSQIKLLFGPLVIQLVWFILKQLFTSVSMKAVDIYLAASRLGEYPPLFTSTSVNNC